MAEVVCDVKQPHEVDSAAEFLAQQQNEIAELENKVLGEIQNQFNFGYMEGDYEDDFSNSSDEINAAGSCEMNGCSPGQNDRDGEPSPTAATQGRFSKMRIEPQKMQRWREQNKKLLANKDRDAERQRQELSSDARKQLEDWDRKRAEWLHKVKKDNRIAQREFIRDRDYMTPGSEWERVAALCDFTPKGVRGIKKDLSRMRSTLLNLKKSPRAVSPSRSSSTSPRLSPSSVRRNKEH